MLLSLFVALTVTPYLGYHLLQEKEEQEHKEEAGLETSWIYRMYNKIERPFLENSTKRRTMLAITLVLLIGSMVMFFTKQVVVKMLPFDNKNEFQIVIDMPEGTTLGKNGSCNERNCTIHSYPTRSCKLSKLYWHLCSYHFQRIGSSL